MLKWMGTVILPKGQNLTSMRQIGLFIGLASTGNTEIGFTIICPSTEDRPTQASRILDLILQLVNRHPWLVLVRPYGHLWWVFCGRTGRSVVGGGCERPLWLCSLCTRH